MSQNAIIGLIVAILIAAGAFFLVFALREDVVVNNDIDITPTPINNNDIVPPVNDDIDNEERNITITSPRPNEEVGLPLVVEGRGRVFEQTLQVRLRDEDGTVLVERFAMTDALGIGQFGPYRVELYYPEPQGQSGMVEAFQYSAEDGSEIDLVRVPVRFANVDAITVEAYFSSMAEDPDFLECGVVHPVERRIPRTQATARAALEQLLAGPTNSEAEEGFFTSIPAGVEIQRLAIENTTAQVDFSEELDRVGGACLVQAISAQIEDTLLQFPTITAVEISVDGRTEDILQP
jgi:hypothetical protein